MRRNVRLPFRRTAAQRACALWLVPSLVMAQVAPPSGLSMPARESLMAEVSKGQKGSWSVQQLLLQEARLTAEDKELDSALTEVQRFALHMANAQLEAHMRQFEIPRLLAPQKENISAVFQFVQASVAITQQAASQTAERALADIQASQVRTLLQEAMARQSDARVKDWRDALNKGATAAQVAKAEIAQQLVRHKAALVQEAERAAQEFSRTAAQVQDVTVKAERQPDEMARTAAEVQSAAKWDVGKVKVALESQAGAVFAVPDHVLKQFAADQIPKVMPAAHDVRHAVQSLAKVNVGLQFEAFRVETVLNPLEQTQKLATRAASSLSAFVKGAHLPPMDAVRTPLLISQLTANPQAMAQAATTRLLGQLPTKTLTELNGVANATKDLKLDFGGWAQTGRSLDGIAAVISSVGALDPKLQEAATKVTSLVATASSFIAVGQSIFESTGKVGALLGVAGQAGSFAATFFSTGGVGTALSLMSGMGGIGGLFGGKKNKSDAALMRKLAEVNRKLDLVLENQRKTLEALVAISEQLQAATNEILREVDGVSQQVTRLEFDQFVQGIESERFPCRSLYLMARRNYSYDTETGTFPAGGRIEFLRAALEVNSASRKEYLADCRIFLERVAESRSILHPYLTDDARTFRADRVFGQTELPPILARQPEAARYAPMRDLTQKFGDDPYLDSGCFKNLLLPQALSAPRTFAEVFALDEACTARVDLTAQAVLEKDLQRPNFVLHRLMHENSVRDYALLVDFYAPLIDMSMALAGRNPNWDKLVREPAVAFSTFAGAAPICRAKPSFGAATSSESERLYSGALTYTNIALGQQYVLSGAALAKQATNILEKYAFGASLDAFGSAKERDADKFNDAQWETLQPIAAGLATGDLSHRDASVTAGGRQPAVADYAALQEHWVSARRKALAPDTTNRFAESCSVAKNIGARPYQTLACTLEVNPTFANNVLQYLLLRAMHDSVPVPDWAAEANPRLAQLPPRAMSMQLYRALLGTTDGQSPLVAQTFARKLPLEYLEGRRPGWFLHLRKHTGEHWYWRLPDASLLESGHVYYPLTEGPLRETQELLASRLAGYAATCLSSEMRADAKLLSRSALVAPPRRPLPSQE